MACDRGSQLAGSMMSKLKKKKPLGYYPWLVLGFLYYCVLQALFFCGIVLGSVIPEVMGGEWLFTQNLKKCRELHRQWQEARAWYAEHTARKIRDVYWLGQIYGKKEYLFWLSQWKSAEDFEQSGRRSSQHWNFTEEQRNLYRQGYATSWLGSPPWGKCCPKKRSKANKKTEVLLGVKIACRSDRHAIFTLEY